MWGCKDTIFQELHFMNAWRYYEKLYGAFLKTAIKMHISALSNLYFVEYSFTGSIQKRWF